MPIKPYSFRFPYDIQTTWDAMRKKFTSTTTGVDSEYPVMLNRMSDRDRSLEDHLNLGVGQGVLQLAIRHTSQSGITDAGADLTGLSVTVTVPEHRALHITARVPIDNTGAANNYAILELLEDALILQSTQTRPLGTTFPGDVETLYISVYRTPTVGTHTYKLRVFSGPGGTVTVASAANDQSNLAVTDIGPSTPISFIGP